jgi:proline iminopeptidase
LGIVRQPAGQAGGVSPWRAGRGLLAGAAPAVRSAKVPDPALRSARLRPLPALCGAGGQYHLAPRGRHRAPARDDRRRELDGLRRVLGQHPDPAVQRQAARAWSLWEGETITLLPNQDYTDLFGDEHYALAFARIENHYFVHEGFFEEGQLIRNAHRLKDIPGVIIQGRYDIATPPKTAWELHKAWPEARFIMVPDAGHAVSEPGIAHHLIEATDAFARDGSLAGGG